MSAVALGDVRDVATFVAWQVERLNTSVPDQFRVADLEEAIDEGIVLAYELYAEWDPARCEKFSAFLLTYLNRRLISWYRKQLRQSGHGSWSGSKNTYTSFGRLSYDALTAPDEDGVHAGSKELALKTWDRDD
jgi:DNA-directed RNA polymerase specialized sigma24 family protein